MSIGADVTERSAAPVPSAAVAEQLRLDILAARLAPGSTVTEAAVTERFGVARPTAKTAIEKLIAAGLLQREIHHAARVPVLGRADIADAYSTRAVIEGAALAALAEGGAVPAAAVAANRALATAASDAPFARDDIAFHRALVEAQPSTRLARLHAGLMGEIELCIGQVQAHLLIAPTEIARQHQRILDAVTGADPELARRLVVEHIEHSRDRVLAHYDQHHPRQEP